MHLYKKIIAFFVVQAFSLTVFAQAQTPADTASAMVIDAMNETAGAFDQVDPSYIHSLGMQQKAWNNPMEHLGEGQTKPGYTKYNWTPDTVLPVRLREGMMTLINLPAWELIEKVHIGSPESFGGEIASSNSLLLYADPNYIGVDSNMIIFGRSGNRYVFYLRSEGFNTDKITQSVVDILVGPRWTPASAGGNMGEATGVSSMAADPLKKTSGNAMGNGSVSSSSVTSAGGVPQDWLKTVPMNPENIRFDLDMFIPNPDDVDIAPDNIWRDDVFTYIDFGPKALSMTQRPVVSMLVQDSETPVGYRTRGPNSRLIVVEGIGDLVLRNGRKVICIKKRRNPENGLEYTDYAPSGMNSMGVSQQYTGEAMMGGAPAIWTQTNYASSASSAQPYCYDASGAGRCGNSTNFANIKSIPDNIMKANQDVVDAAFKNEIVPVVGTESIAIELGTSQKISELENLWSKISKKNTDILSGYEPYYSVDATADGGVLELFRLRAGMVKDVLTAESICRKLGKRGYSCSVVKIQ